MRAKSQRRDPIETACRLHERAAPHHEQGCSDRAEPLVQLALAIQEPCWPGWIFFRNSVSETPCSPAW
jgi:hypothetical protein